MRRVLHALLAGAVAVGVPVAVHPVARHQGDERKGAFDGRLSDDGASWITDLNRKAGGGSCA